jgi:CheY-like chemotaxis protein
MTHEVPPCTVCGKPVFPTAPTMFRTAQYTTHPRCIRVPKPSRIPRNERAASQEAYAESDAVRGDAKRTLDDAVTYLGSLLTGVEVLIIAQRDVVGEVLQRFFRSLGAIALPATSVEHAIGLVQALCPEVILCDVSLLAFEDRSLVQRIREQCSGRGFPLVLGIGAATTAERAIAGSAALDGYVPKPIGYRELADALRSLAGARADWMDRHRERVRLRGESLRAKSARHRVDAEVTRLKAQGAISRAEKLAARAKAQSTSFRSREGRLDRPRYRPRLLGY